jgi:hypothetical protein
MAMSQGTQSKLQSSFMAGAGAMEVDGPGNAAAVSSSVSSALKNMTQQLESVAEGLKAEVAGHQAEQQGQKPADFDADMPDLRSTTAQGFPGERGDDFFADVKR